MSEYVSKNEIMKRLERFAIAVCTAAVSVTSWALWENYQTNQRITIILTEIQRNDARQDQAIAEIKGQMVTWDTLRRIELYLSGHPAENRGSMIGNALTMEIEVRKQAEGLKRIERGTP